GGRVRTLPNSAAQPPRPFPRHADRGNDACKWFPFFLPPAARVLRQGHLSGIDRGPGPGLSGGADRSRGGADHELAVKSNGQNGRGMNAYCVRGFPRIRTEMDSQEEQTKAANPLPLLVSDPR